MSKDAKKIIKSLVLKYTSFGDSEHFKEKDMDMLDVFISVVVNVGILFFLLLVGKDLWNKVLCKLVTITKPMESEYEVLGLWLLLFLLFSR